MDQKAEKFHINNYVLYKSSNEWREGRIKNIIQDKGRIIYRIISFHNYSEVSLTSDDSISISSPETRRKLKLNLFDDIPNKTHIPPLLENLLILDKEWMQHNSYESPPRVTVRQALDHFREFLLGSFGEADEIHEAYLGFQDLFNSLLPLFLLYGREKQSYTPLSTPPSENYGPVYLLRLIYFLQKNGRYYMNDPVAEAIMLDYTVYLLDYLLMRHNDYF